MSLKRNALIVVGLVAVAKCLAEPSARIEQAREMARECTISGCDVEGQLIQPVVTDDEPRLHCPVCGGYWADDG